MATIRAVLIASMLMILAGCLSISVGWKDPFSAYVGRPVELLRDAYLTQSRPDQDSEMRDDGSVFRIDHFTDGRVSQLGEQFDQSVRLPKGTKISITSVDRIALITAGVSIRARGRLIHPVTREEVSFVYEWAMSGTFLRRAPWEGMEVPARRPIPFG